MLRAASFQNVDEAAGGGMQIGFVADGMQPAAKKRDFGTSRWAKLER